MKPSAKTKHLKKIRSRVDLFNKHSEEFEKTEKRIKEEGFDKHYDYISLSKISPSEIAKIAASIEAPISPRERIELAYELLDRSIIAQRFLCGFESVEESQNDFDKLLEYHARSILLIKKHKTIYENDIIQFKDVIKMMFPGSGGHNQKMINTINWIQHDFRCNLKEAELELNKWINKGVPREDFIRMWFNFPSWHKGYVSFGNKIAGIEPPKKGSKPRGRPRKSVGVAIAANQKAEFYTPSGTNSTIKITARKNASAIGLKTEKQNTKKNKKKS